MRDTSFAVLQWHWILLSHASIKSCQWMALHIMKLQAVPSSTSACPSAMLPAGQAEPATVRHAPQTHSLHPPQPAQRRKRRLVKGPRPVPDAYGEEEGMPATKRRLPASPLHLEQLLNPSGNEKLLQKTGTYAAEPSRSQSTGRYTILSMAGLTTMQDK